MNKIELIELLLGEFHIHHQREPDKGRWAIVREPNPRLCADPDRCLTRRELEQAIEARRV